MYQVSLPMLTSIAGFFQHICRNRAQNSIPRTDCSDVNHPIVHRCSDSEWIKLLITQLYKLEKCMVLLEH